ncbi:MAG TPA: translation elongation factor 4 [Candidatus Saccharimonadales bacterium]|jgi:GTP-binding protein LepA
MNQSKIRNFCIIAHIDHGKSTLADRLLEVTGTVEKRQMKEQVLDRMDLEREKGITIKLQPVRMEHEGYELNLIDTPGHVDFGYEVSRSLAACEGALLVVDATQGIQAQTLANVYLALEADLTIIPIVNKIDLPAAETLLVKAELVSLLGCNEEDILEVSAKTGQGVDEIIEVVIDKLPPPDGQVDSPVRALVFDSQYDEYRGVILYLRMMDGILKKNDSIAMMAAGSSGQALEVGMLSPDFLPREELGTGEIGYVVTSLRDVNEARVGDTLTLAKKPASQALEGYKKVRPFVYAGLFPASSDDYPALKEALERLSLSDSALLYEPENSMVLGFGFRVGFLGLLHMEIVQERLEREYGLELIVTNPSTDYKVELTSGEHSTIKNVADLPEASQITSISEPWIEGEIVCPKDYVGAVIQLIVSARGQQKHIDYVDDRLSIIRFDAPLAGVLTDFFDNLKSATSGYGSFSYELKGYKKSDLIKLDVLVAGDRVDALSVMVHKPSADNLGRDIVAKLKEIIPRQQFEVSLQAAIGGKVIARENISPLKKNVTGHLYGGDVSRKKKLWAKQAKGKARMKKFGKVDIPPETFMVMLKKD